MGIMDGNGGLVPLTGLGDGLRGSAAAVLAHHRTAGHCHQPGRGTATSLLLKPCTS